MKRLLLFTITLSAGMATVDQASADNQSAYSESAYSSSSAAGAPPAPRPFKVKNSDGTVTTVNPSAEGRLRMQQSDLPANNETKKPVNFLTNSAPREPKTGYYAGAMLGFNIDAYQGSNFTNLFSDGRFFEGEPRIFNGANSNMSLGPMASIKFGHVWPFGEPIDQFENETGGLRIGGALEAEFIYLHGFHEFSQGNPNSLSGDVQQITFAPMVNALLKAYWGRSEIYTGVGVGVAVTIFDGDGGNAPNNDSFGDFAYQFILGYEFHMNEEWSIFAESKYLTIQDVTYLSDGDSAHVLMGIGVKKQLF